MLCRNCKNPLGGDEDFCPRCGAPQKLTDISSNSSKPDEEESLQPQTPKPQESSIFQSDPVYIYADTPKEKSRKKPKLALSLVSIFILTVLIIGAVSLAQYFKLTPAFSDLFQTQEQPQETKPSETTTAELDSTVGVIPPDINFKGTIYTVMNEKGLSLRKGPDNTYALIDNIPFGTLLQAIGKSLQNDLWVYAYIPSSDLYGWVCGSYITEASVLDEADITTSSQTSQEENSGRDETEPTVEKMSRYLATVIASKGLYLRQGPGTDYDAISVVAKGETVTVLEPAAEDDSWLYVSVGNEKGYMNKAYLK